MQMNERHKLVMSQNHKGREREREKKHATKMGKIASTWQILN